MVLSLERSRQLNQRHISMRSVKAVYENGFLMFPEGTAPEGRVEVVVVFPDRNEPRATSKKDKNAGKRFVRKWKGFLKGVNIEGWREQRIADLEKKHQ
jgi:hypothetical protein